MYGTLGGIMSIGLLAVAVGWLFGNVMGKWGLKRGAEAEKKNPQLLLDRISEGVFNTQRLKLFTKESCDVIINDLRTVKVQIFNHLKYMNGHQLKDANKLSKDIDAEIDRLEHYKAHIVEDRVYKLEELRY